MLFGGGVLSDGGVLKGYYGTVFHLSPIGKSKTTTHTVFSSMPRTRSINTDHTAGGVLVVSKG